MNWLQLKLLNWLIPDLQSVREGIAESKAQISAFNVDVKKTYSRLESYKKYSESMVHESRVECHELNEKVRSMNQKFDAIAESLGVFVIDDVVTGEIKFAASGPRAAASKKSAQATIDLAEIRKIHRQCNLVLRELELRRLGLK